jgi:hypothetical protein
MSFSRMTFQIALIAFVSAIEAINVQAQTIVSNEQLVTSTFVISTSSVTAQCLKAGCSAQSQMLSAIPVTCPAAIGATCTFHIALDSRIDVALPCGGLVCSGTSGAFNSYQFLVDGTVPSPGLTDPQGYYVFSKNVNSFTRFPSRQPYPATIVATVTNATSQDHTIDVNIKCSDVLKENGCGLIVNSTQMRVDVFEP